MGKIFNWLNEQLGESKTKKLLSIIGGFFIILVANFPITNLILSFELAGFWVTYIIIGWAAFVITITSVIVLFFGKPPENLKTSNESEKNLEIILEKVLEIVSRETKPEVTTI